MQKLPDAAVLSHHFAEYAPLPDISLLLTHPDCDGPLVVSAVSVQGGDVVFQPFPADGKPHWRLDCESGEIFYTCDLDEAVGFVEDWLDFCQSTRLIRQDLPLRVAAEDLPPPSAVLPQQLVWSEGTPPDMADWLKLPWLPIVRRQTGSVSPMASPATSEAMRLKEMRSFCRGMANR